MKTNQILLPAFAIIFMIWLFTLISSALVVVSQFFMLGFLGILFGLFLTRCSTYLASKLKTSYGISLGMVVTSLAAISLLTILFAGQSIESHAEKALEQVDDSARKIEKWLEEHPTAKSFSKQIPFGHELLREAAEPGQSTAQKEESGNNEEENNSESDPLTGDQGEEADSSASKAAQSGLSTAIEFVVSILQTALAAVMNIAIVIVVGIFWLLTRSCIRMVLSGYLNLPGEAKHATSWIGRPDQLWAWLLGRFATMFITAAGTGISLAIIGVPIPVVLGVLTGLLTFIPNIGAAIALTLALLISLPEGLSTAGLVIITFVLFQVLESYVITPLIQQKAVSIPPALLITWQVLLGMTAGFLGVAIATPLLAVLLVLIKTVYLEEVLEVDPEETPDESIQE
ncbi:MAG: AI-2E family transporter [Planctomycetaceae bacterium]